MAGCSGTPLYRKLGLKPGMVAVRLHAPLEYDDLLGPDAPEVNWQDQICEGFEFCHLFTSKRAELDQVLQQGLQHMARDGVIWVSWPKKASKRPTEVTEDVVRDVALPLGLVDIKVCAVDAIWSGLKLVIRKELR